MLPKNYPNVRKILILTSFLALSAWCLTSCNKQSDIKVVDSQTGNGPSGSGGSGGGVFNWTGTEPMSAKVNGTPWTPYGAVVNVANGFFLVQGQALDGTGLNLMVPTTATNGKVFSAPTPAAIMWIDPIGGVVLQASSGKVKITTNSATTLEGYFYGDLKDPQGLSPTVLHVTEGYFKVEKP